MQAYKVRASLRADGELLLRNLPFRAGDDVEVIVLDAQATPAANGGQPIPAHAQTKPALEAWIAECDKVADLWEGEFDAVADLRRIREEDA